MKKFLYLLICLFSYQLAFAANEFNLYIGSNYIADSTVKRFDDQNNCTLVQNFFNDNEEMLAKIVAGANGYNTIVATSYAVEELALMGKIKPLDKSKLPNLKYINKQFLNQAYDPDNKYSVPYAYTPVFLAYNKDKLRQLGIVPDTWAVIFDPKYLNKLKGKVTVFDSSRNVIAAALLYLGKDPNSEKESDLLAARAVIDRAAPYWAKFDSDSYYRGLLRGDVWVSMSYSIDIFKTIQDAKASHAKVNIDAMLQKEGNMYELDNMVIPVFNKDDKLAYAFINMALSPQSAYELSALTGSSVPNDSAVAKLDPAVRNLDWIYPKNMNKMYVFKAYPPKTRILVNEMWTEIKMNGACWL
ncbi:MAG: spermidine/putrescine ABC transporter substrate-binding protein [Neisseriales bacterium]|jgi:spermidine/putrescine transport system substrate-binding protein|nr:MAG: spermidine/putrescine ABC transporter substrate-binding protein [Neisseriales bacterium]HRG63076.1 spermidine/putrescine ABC transporter substrate-binding protein [Burkholderiales bacterium]